MKELVANACRRADEGKYDDAVARLYRALEMLAQVRFIELFGRSTTGFPISSLSEEVREKMYPKCSPDSKVHIGCREAFDILFLSGDEIGKIYNENKQEIHRLLSARNDSIMAHGTIPLGRKAFDKFLGIFPMFNIDYSKIKFPQIDSELLSGIGLVEALQ